MKRAVDIGTENQVFTILLAGNPNVGKSTIFNAMTGLRQHTGNWPGKTVEIAEGRFSSNGIRCRLVDLPGTYSLHASSPEEEITRNALIFGSSDRVLLVADAVGLERSLLLVLQTIAIAENAVLCVNLMDEAKKRGITVDVQHLSALLGIPVVGCSARRKQTLLPLKETLVMPYDGKRKENCLSLFPDAITESLRPLYQRLKERFPVTERRAMWMAVTLVGQDTICQERLFRWCGEDLKADETIAREIDLCREKLRERGLMDCRAVEETISQHQLSLAKKLADCTVSAADSKWIKKELRIDRILTSRAIGYPAILLLLTGIFALTIRGADIPSQLLAKGLFWLGDKLSVLLLGLGCPRLLHDAIVFGAYRMLAWVVSVMLPPMLIFFPLFTFLEDVGYLPRIAFNLDHCFHRCGSCGKQALTMGMGLGCNAVGVTSCRIIASKKERLLAILTNSFIPCNGRFPMMILLIGLFLSPAHRWSALILCACILLAIAVTLGVTKLLSVSLLKGENSAFILELPPYRQPQIGQILVRSLLDRSVFVLGRAAAVAAPAGLLLWALSSVKAGDGSLLTAIAAFLEPLGQLMGMDGVILLAFVLGSAANETVIPIAMMIYLSASDLSGNLPAEQIRLILADNGWTWLTAASTVLFTMMHWPCTTTLLTIRKETGSAAWTALAAVLPTVCGIIACLILHGIAAALA